VLRGVEENRLDRLEVLHRDRDAQVVGDIHRVHNVEIPQRESVRGTEGMRGLLSSLVTPSDTLGDVFEKVLSDRERWTRGAVGII
jgi:hypothetical protein